MLGLGQGGNNLSNIKKLEKMKKLIIQQRRFSSNNFFPAFIGN